MLAAASFVPLSSRVGAAVSRAPAKAERDEDHPRVAERAAERVKEHGTGIPRYASWVIASSRLADEQWAGWRLLVGRQRTEIAGTASAGRTSLPRSGRTDSPRCGVAVRDIPGAPAVGDGLLRRLPRLAQRRGRGAGSAESVFGHLDAALRLLGEHAHYVWRSTARRSISGTGNRSAERKCDVPDVEPLRSLRLGGRPTRLAPLIPALCEAEVPLGPEDSSWTRYCTSSATLSGGAEQSVAARWLLVLADATPRGPGG